MRPFIALAIVLAAGSLVAAKDFPLDKLDLQKIVQGWGSTKAGRSVDNNPLRIGGKEFSSGIGTHASSRFYIELGGQARRFRAFVGVDDECLGTSATIKFLVYGDGKKLWESGILRPAMAPVPVDVKLAGVDVLLLMVTGGGDNINYDHADWASARIDMIDGVPVALSAPREEAVILTPKPGPKPRLTGPRIVGTRPGNPFIHRITATGKRPLHFQATGLPEGLTLNEATGDIRGSSTIRGTARVRIVATNAEGTDERTLRIETGDQICLTPPLGWNSWNCWALSIDDAKVRAAADSVVKSGLADHGWTYINIDDAWEIKPDGSDPDATGPARDENGLIICNSKFPDMKGLTDYVHGQGLKIGIYSSPGRLTCAGYEATYGREAEDAQLWADWGFDYIKYDWCSYGKIARDQSREELMKPYQVMRSVLDQVPRDIVYSLCQYGMGEVWEWGAQVGGNCWRTTGDIVDTWDSMAGIGFDQAGKEQHASPGHWNDPDMLVVGYVGWGPNLHPSRLTPNEQYTHISLWCLLASPLLIGCDLARLDDFTLSLLTNDEVLDVNQDPLGRQARRVQSSNETQVWAKEMEDGSLAVGLFNLGELQADVEVSLETLGVSGNQRVRDLWRQQDLETATESIAHKVPRHGVVLVRLWGERK